MAPESSPAMAAAYRALRTDSIPRAYEGLAAVGLAADEEACGHYRVIHPFALLNRLGAACRSVRVGTGQVFEHADIVVAQRQWDPEVLRGLLYQKGLGKQIVYDIDDHLHAVPTWSPAARGFAPHGPVCRGIHAFLGAVHGATVSTPELAEVYAPHCPQIVVVPNAIDFSVRDWAATDPRPEGPADAVLIGWAGGVTHSQDLLLLAPVLPAVLARHPEARVVLYGNEAMLRGLAVEMELPPDRVAFLPPRDFAGYPRGLCFDIGLAPLLANPFNRCKSNLKVLEYGAKGIPTVASPAPSYARTITPGQDGLLAATTEEWIAGISELVADEGRRREMGAQALALVRRDYDLDQSAHRWPRAWRAIAQGEADAGGPRVPWGSLGRNAPCPCGSGLKYKRCACYGRWGR